jgi:molecular chaperone DnaK
MKVGIDLGTTNSVVARLDDEGEPEVIRNKMGDEKTPSVVQFREDEAPVIGQAAVNDYLSYPDQTVAQVKRHMGEDWSTEILGEEYTAPEISARILDKLKRDAEDAADEDVEEVVITVPAEFGTRGRQATIDAATMGLSEQEGDRFSPENVDDNVELLTEPVAACLRYGLKKDFSETIFVYDMGGGTFDATIVRVDGEDFKVEGTKGGKRLGGEDIDERLLKHVRGELLDKGAPDPDENEAFRQDVMEEVRTVKHSLSQQEEATLAVNIGAGEIVDVTVTRDEFEDLIEDLIDKSVQTTQNLFDDENVAVTKDEIDDVILVGGSTRIPLIHEKVEEFFGFEPSTDLRQDFVVGEGAAIQTERERSGGDGGTGTGRIQNVLPETIGVAIKEDGNLVFDKIIQENRTIDEDGVTETKDGYKKVDTQSDRVEIQLLQGGQTLAEDNDELGTFYVEGLEPGKDPEFEIEFAVTNQGRLDAEVTNKMTGDVEDHTIDIGLEEQVIKSGTDTIRREREERDEDLTRE